MVKKNVANSICPTATAPELSTVRHPRPRLFRLVALLCKVGVCGLLSSLQLTLLKGEHSHGTRENCHNVFTRSSSSGGSGVAKWVGGGWGGGNTIMTSLAWDRGVCEWNVGTSNEVAARMRMSREKPPRQREGESLSLEKFPSRALLLSIIVSSTLFYSNNHPPTRRLPQLMC